MEVSTSSREPQQAWGLRVFCLSVRPGEQQVAIADETDNVQAKWPEPGTQAADVSRQAESDAAGEWLLPAHAEQIRILDGLTSVVQQRHEQPVLGRRTRNDDPIDNHHMLRVAVLHLMPMQLCPFHLLEHCYLWHAAASPCSSPAAVQPLRASV